MEQKCQISLIGPGVMAEAIIGGVLKKGLTAPECMAASGPHLDRVEELQARYGIRAFTDNAAAVAEADVVILSVKPQRIGRVIAGLKGHIPQDALVLSIVAGATLNALTNGLGHNIVVRAMPNTPAQIGEGITVWTCTGETSPEQREVAQCILSSLGDEVFVEEENYLDMATALSGSGPSYVFLFMEAMIDAGVHLGFPRRIAEQLVVQTLKGSVDYYESKKSHAARLRNEVTSPGGTSAEALYYLEKAGFRTALSRAIWAAYERSQELGLGKDTGAPEKR